MFTFGILDAGISQFHDGRYAHHTISLRRFRARGVYCNGYERNISFCSLRDATCNARKCDGSEMGLKCDYGELKLYLHVELK